VRFLVNIVILGCGRVGSTIATAMSMEGHDVTIIDMNPDSFRRLKEDFTGRKVVGNGIDEDTLRRAAVDKADAFVAPPMETTETSCPSRWQRCASK
jgi:trk system potassium uptake protein TrkA